MNQKLAMAAAVLLACAGCDSPGDQAKPAAKQWTTGATPTVKPEVAADRKLTVEELDKMLKAKVDCVVIDARNPDPQWQNGLRIPGAKPLYFMEGADTIQAAVGPDKGKLIVVYCGDINCPASAHLAKRLARLGYTNIKVYPAGSPEWERSG